jgi:hypothetical protein
MYGVTVSDLLKILQEVPEDDRDDVYVYVSGSKIWTSAAKAEYDEMATCHGGIVIHLSENL